MARVKKNNMKTLDHVSFGQLIVKCVELATSLASVFFSIGAE